MKVVAASMRIVLAGIGSAPPQAGVAAAAPTLASLLALPLRALETPEDPDAWLASLDRDPSQGWLAPLPLDVGRPLARGGSWAESLGAWRQPTLLLLEADQVATGLPAAATALLRQWRVPLLGLVQAGGEWEPHPRRLDGLPWLGALASPELGPCLQVRWDQLQAQLQ